MNAIRSLGRIARDALFPFRRAVARADRARDAAQWQAAAVSYAAALEIRPRDADIWVQYGHALKEVGLLVEAERAYRRALSLHDRKADTHLQLGHALRRLDRDAEAMEAYVRAVELDRDLNNALDGIEALARLGVPVPGARVYPTTGAAGETVLGLWPGVSPNEPPGPALPDEGTYAPLVFDVSDLLSYFRSARLPTGIQRVQIEVVRGLLLDPATEATVRVCAYSEALDDWVEIPGAAFVRLCERSLASGDRAAAVWVSALRQLDLYLIAADRISFVNHSILVNLGTSWWIQNYFLNVRRIKQAHKILYVPFVHDMIPIMTPEHCLRELTQNFITWTLGVFQHADMFLVNSVATQCDLVAVAATLGHAASLGEIEVVALDADFRQASLDEASAPLQAEWGLEPGGFVLLVSTIESRKNHVTAFDAWLSLIEKHGAANVPKLVCVGGPGWLNEAVHARLATSQRLQHHVKMLSDLSDEKLAALYRNALFTLYPSLYEGWGLPVTESLCYGKAALISDVSSLPEAGGRFADYFPAGSAEGLAAAAERLIFEPGYRQGREASIAEGFAPRSWAAIGTQMAAATGRLRDRIRAAANPQSIKALEPMPAKLGVFYAFSRNFEQRIWPGMVLGEMFRVGGGWRWPDDCGSSTKPPGGGLAIRVEAPHGPLRVVFGIRAAPNGPCNWSLAFNSPAVVCISGRLAPGELSWIGVDFPASARGSDIAGTLASSNDNKLASKTDGVDLSMNDVGLAGLYVYAADDLSARESFAEAVLMNNFEALAPGHADG